MVLGQSSKSNEDLKKLISELEEKLRLLTAEKAAGHLRMEELQKKLEMSELLLQQSHFLQCMKEKGDLEHRMSELECRFHLYCGETNTIIPTGQYNALQHNQDATLKACSQENTDYISWLEHNQGEMESPFLAPTPALPALQDFRAADRLTNHPEISLADPVPPAQSQAMMGSLAGNLTGEKAEQLLPDMKKPQECAGLGSNPCMPFYQTERDELNILVI
ncbi:Golgin subfamily A member 2 [Tupaia chinensis]|uniref:Golgin subfamily A member 2 n=1 Tax=Tupaia chinensis TaxID=246437 RepID=L9JA81_TUPCH|nr:Golgin subfamily A member 2 [Tupaia chinensis]